MELTKWFDTNYHYLVPEFSADQTFRLASDKPFAELAEAQAAGVPAKPVLLGPITFLLLGKMTGGDDSASPLSLLEALLPVYAEVIQRLAVRRRGVDPARRAGSGARSHPGSTRRRRACLRRLWPKRRAPPSCCCRPPTATSARPIRRSRRCRSTVSGSISCGGRRTSISSRDMASRPTNGWRRASSTGATSGRTTSPPRSICSVASRSMSRASG